MARRPSLDPDQRQRMLLRAVAGHPWSRAPFLTAVSGLRPVELSETLRRVLAQGLIEQTEIPGWVRASARYGLTPAGAAAIGRPFSRVTLGKVLLRALTLEAARLALLQWLSGAGLVWAFSPYTVPATATRSARWPGRALQLEMLAGLRWAERRFLSVAVWTDPGDLKLDWLFEQFRAAQTWARRPEFADRAHAFPASVVLAPPERASDVVLAWRAAAGRSETPGLLRVVEIAELASGLAWTERGQRGPLWAGLAWSDRPAIQPAHADALWHGELAASEWSALTPGDLAARPARKTSLLTWLARSRQPAARRLRAHLAVSAPARTWLDRIGQYPLITARDLAVVMGCTVRNIRLGMHELLALGLIWRPAEGERGYALTWAGLELLADQAGVTPRRYAQLRRWPLGSPAGTRTVSAAGWLAIRAHTRLVLDFLVGLRGCGPAAGLHLARWDHVQCLYDLPAGQMNGWRERVIPDAAGAVERDGSVLAFWLEVDRGTIRGRALTDKLRRYYEAGSRHGRPRLLVLVETEARLQSLRRRCRALNQLYRARLSVALTRVDLLRDAAGRLDPTQPAWRTPEDSQLRDAFARELP